MSDHPSDPAFSSPETLKRAGFTARRPRGREKPQRSKGGMHDAYKETHPAYAMIGASRVSATPGYHLYGSDFRHQHLVMVSIRRSELSRSTISTEHHYGSDELIEVALSEAQWATFVSAMNVGQGVPCTLEYIGGDGYMPYIEPVDDRRIQFTAEVDARLQSALGALDEAMALATTKKQRAAIEAAKRTLTDGLPWVAKQFDEHAEQTVEKAKIEVAAYVTAAIQRAGLKALGGVEAPVLLDTGESDAE